MVRVPLLVLGPLLVGLAAAQEVTLEPTAAQRCLTPAAEQRGKPDYPIGPFKRNESGRVAVELTFTTTDKRPAVAVLSHEGSDEFVDAVREHVSQFRVPCLGAADIPARLQIDFQFKPDDREVHWSEPVDAGSRDRPAQLKCLVHASGDKFPEYPAAARRSELQGRVLARLRFSAPDQPPAAEVFARPAAQPLAAVVRHWVAGYRLPCLEGGPLEATWTFVFRLDDDVFGFRPLNLLQFLGAVRDIRKQTLRFDFNAMGCPFDLKFMYRQPYLPNAVGEVGGSQAARRPFLAWLAGVELDLPKRSQDAVFGDSVTLPIPCTKINLNPQGETQ
jgi:hypothetical protein